MTIVQHGKGRNCEPPLDGTIAIILYSAGQFFTPVFLYKDMKTGSNLINKRIDHRPYNVHVPDIIELLWLLLVVFLAELNNPVTCYIQFIVGHHESNAK